MIIYFNELSLKMPLYKAMNPPMELYWWIKVIKTGQFLMFKIYPSYLILVSSLIECHQSVL